jgi:hypothetical protein
MLSVANKPIMSSVVMLNVVAPFFAVLLLKNYIDYSSVIRVIV